MNPTQKQLVRQETFESCMLTIDEFIGHASDLEAVGDTTDARELRELVGHIENFVADMRLRHH